MALDLFITGWEKILLALSCDIFLRCISLNAAWGSELGPKCCPLALPTIFPLNTSHTPYPHSIPSPTELGRLLFFSDLTDGRGAVLCPEAPPLLENCNSFFKIQIKCLISLHLCLSLAPRQSCGSFYRFP